MSCQVVDETNDRIYLRNSALVVEGISAHVTLDLRGLACPLPPLKTMRALRRMQPGQILEVLGTSPVGKRSAPWLARKLGNELLAVVQDENESYRFFIRKR